MWIYWRSCFATALAAALISGCGGSTPQPTAPQAETRQPVTEAFVTRDGERFPALAPLGPPPIPLDNQQTLDKDGFPLLDDPKVQLGKILFFDTRLSGDNSVSCATCHAPDQGWGLNSTISRGYPGTSHWRNSQTVINSAYLWKLFWEGSALALGPQAKAANTGLSGNGKTDMMEERIRQVPEYVKRFKEVFGADVPILEDSWRAIGAFQRALNQPDTPFDLYMKGDKKALDEQQVRGLDLFQGKAGCIQCHNGPLFTDQKYYNLGVTYQESFLEDPLQQITHRWQYYQKGSTEEFYRKGKFDLGLYFVSHRDEDIGKFRTAPLRYLEYTAPYMHHGVFDDLMEVVNFYNDGGGEDLALKEFGLATKTKRLKKLNLTAEEKEDLIAFLDSLSGDEIRMELPKIPDTMAFVDQGETWVGMPIPVVSDDLAARQSQDTQATWSLVKGPQGVTVDPKTGRVTWPNAQPQSAAPGQDVPVTITIRATKANGDTEDQTLLVTVLRQALASR
ncbi:MAG: cytochrome-c peroxidase [Acidobacteria bacterium]|nr:cytochrome-c peroxidase [Acidobacteriota bacterium]